MFFALKCRRKNVAFAHLNNAVCTFHGYDFPNNFLVTELYTEHYYVYRDNSIDNIVYMKNIDETI